jgi:hypothetical protein
VFLSPSGPLAALGLDQVALSSLASHAFGAFFFSISKARLATEIINVQRHPEIRETPPPGPLHPMPPHVAALPVKPSAVAWHPVAGATVLLSWLSQTLALTPIPHTRTTQSLRPWTVRPLLDVAHLHAAPDAALPCPALSSQYPVPPLCLPRCADETRPPVGAIRSGDDH